MELASLRSSGGPFELFSVSGCQDQKVRAGFGCVRSERNRPERTARGADPSVEVVVVLEHQRTTTGTVIGRGCVLPNLGLDLSEGLGKGGVDLLVLPQPFDDFENGIDLRNIGLSAPVGSDSGISGNAEIGDDGNDQQDVSETETPLADFSFYSAHGLSSSLSGDSNGNSFWSRP